MAQLKTILGKLEGSAGTLSFKNTHGEIIVSERITEVKQVRTKAQQ